MPDLFLIGEAWGADEDREKAPFVGAAGYHLTQMLAHAGIRRTDCYLTNVFNFRPPLNDISAVCGPKSESIEGYPQLLTSRPTYKHWRGGYVRAEFQPELTRLAAELVAENPNLVVTLGNTAMWALLGKTAISKYRGTTALSTHTATGFKVLPTYHPAAIMRQWELRPITVIDLAKAQRECAFPEIRRPEVMIYVPETVEELQDLATGTLAKAERLAIDIETSGSQITCIGFAPLKGLAVVVPIHDYRRSGRSYWPSLEAECAVWKIIRNVCQRERPPKVFQNGLYDIAFLSRSYGIRVRGAEHDTMLLHHALQPEMLKGLGFLGSVYTDHGAWKQEREKTWTIKRDE